MPATRSRNVSRRTPRAARPRTLRGADVVAAAVRLAERDGLDALSMRTLARELGIEAMSVYSHVADKQQLLGEMAAHIVASVPAARGGAPRARLLRLAQGIREAARRYPNVFPLVVLLPLRVDAAAVFPEAALQAFLDAGLPDAAAARAQRTFLSYVRGFVLWEIGGFAAGRRKQPMEAIDPRVLADIDALDPSRFPQMRRLARTMVSLDPSVTFRDGCATIVDCLLGRGGTRR